MTDPNLEPCESGRHIWHGNEACGEVDARELGKHVEFTHPEVDPRGPVPAPSRMWHEIAPADAVEIDLTKDLTITAPLNESGERCPWPWEPQQLVGAPIGQYHCGYCGAMVIAGVPHIDYRDTDEETR